MRRSFLAIIVLCAMSLPAYAQEQESDLKLRMIIGMDRATLKSCDIDSDCTLVPSFSDCCRQESINKEHKDRVNDHHKALWQAFASDEMKESCKLRECQPPVSRAVCRQNQCTLDRASSMIP